MHLLHLIWSVDFDALQAKLGSIARFAAFLVAGASVAANFLKNSEHRAAKVVKWLALNWHTGRGVLEEKAK